jgi:transposase-like protein
MKSAPGLRHIILASLLLVTLTQVAERLTPVWDKRLLPPQRVRRRCNPRRNRERWARRRTQWRRRQPRVSRGERRQRRARVLREILNATPGATIGKRWQPLCGCAPLAGPTAREASWPTKEGADEVDPLAELRQSRGWIDHMDEQALWDMLVQIRWPHGVVCPCCGEDDPRYLKLLDADYRGGLGRWQCLVCAGAGDPGEGGTFTPLTGTILEGMRIDVRTLWLVVESFASGVASVETSKEARVNRRSTDRLFRLLRAAIYQTRSPEPIVLGPEDIAEMDEVYITAGLKGNAGGLALEREPRKRGLKRRGRGTWDSDRLPVFGLLCRGGEARLFVLRNVQTATIRPIVEQMVQRGARVYTDGYCIYHFLSREGYQHMAVNHGAGEYALDLDGDGACEVHCNTMEGTWSWLRQMIRTYRGVSKVYLPLYVAQFEFLFNRRHKNRWNRTLDVLQAAFQVEAVSADHLLACVSGAQFAEVCPVAG